MSDDGEPPPNPFGESDDEAVPPRDQAPDTDGNPDGNVVTPRRRRRRELELLTPHLDSPVLLRSARARQPPDRLSYSHAQVKARGRRRRDCADCRERLTNLLRNLSF